MIRIVEAVVMDDANFIMMPYQSEITALFREFGERVFTRESVQQWIFDQGLPDNVVQEFVRLYFAVMEDGLGSAPTHRLMAQAQILEELCRCAGVALPFQNDMFGLEIMEAFASDNDFSAVIDDYKETGRVMFALAVSEPQAGSDSMNMATNVRTVGGKLILNGRKTFVNNGEYAPHILVAAIDKDEQRPLRYPPLSFWFIPRTLAGITAVPLNKIGQLMVPFASVNFDEVVLDPTYRLTGSAIGFPRLFALLEFGRVFSCAASLGMAQAAMDDAVHYASKREAFGQRISEFQQVGQMLTDMEVRLWTMRSLLYEAAYKIDADAPDKRLAAALMKRYIPQAATAVASDAMQILGGIGYTEGERVGHIWQDCRGNQLAEGTDQIMVYIATPLILEKYQSQGEDYTTAR